MCHAQGGELLGKSNLGYLDDSLLNVFKVIL